MTAPIGRAIPLPQAPNAYSREFMQNLLARLQAEFLGKVSKTEAVDTIIMRSPNGQMWDVSVSNAGALVVTAHDGSTRL